MLEFARVCGLDADAVLEPGFGEPERRIFVDAGRESLFEQVYGVPAVLVVRWRKRWDY